MNVSKIILWIIGIVMLFFAITAIRQCSDPTNNDIVKIVVPEKSGYFNLPPIYMPKENQKDSILIKYKTVTNNDTIYKDSIIYTENPVNKQLAKSYANTKDSLERFKLYLKAIEEREGTSVFDNEDLKLEVYTKTRGELLSIKPTYTIKERTIQATVPKKVPVFALYGGAETIINKDVSNVGVKADIGLQNKKGNILTIGIDNRQNYYIGAKFKIFDIKK